MSLNKPSSSKKIEINNVTSILDLKTEFIKRKKAATDQNNLYKEGDVNRSRSNLLAITKEEKKLKEEKSMQRTHRIRENEEAIRKEEQEYQNRQRILSQKAQIYDKMTKDGSLVYEDGKEADFLVNFEEKRRELQEKKDTKAFTETKEYSKYDEEEKEHIPTPLIVHYNPAEEPGREFGPSHVPLAVDDEDKRRAQIEDIKRLTAETNANRLKQQQKTKLEKTIAKKRVNALRVQKGLPELPLKLSDIPLPTEPEPKEKTFNSDETEPKKARYGVREWDRGKWGYTKWISKQREERDEEFQPPSFYFDK